MNTIRELKQQEKYNNMLKRKNKEIERLNNLLKETSQTLSEQTTKAITLKSENERLNNIINELEKTLLEWHEFWEDNDEYYWQYKNAYDYLQELKGENKGE